MLLRRRGHATSAKGEILIVTKKIGPRFVTKTNVNCVSPKQPPE